jgi:hypothetical protein
MLSLQTIHPDTLELLKTLMRLPILGQMRLVGGTSLALQYGHRRSIDLDLFGNTTDDVDELTEVLHDSVENVVRGNCSKRIKAYYTDGSEYRALISMAYFADADPQPMPYMFENVEWETVKNRIRKEVEDYSHNHS